MKPAEGWAAGRWVRCWLGRCVALQGHTCTNKQSLQTGTYTQGLVYKLSLLGAKHIASLLRMALTESLFLGVFKIIPCLHILLIW